jgi:hypothetical protein
MRAWEALQLAAGDLWDDSWLLVVLGLVGGLLSLLVLPLPFVLAAHYGTVERLTENRVISVRDWLENGRAHAPFFYKWAALVLVVSALFWSNFFFYAQYEAAWATTVSGLTVGLWVVWLLPQPLVPALYFWQEDRRVRVALRNAGVIALSDPLSVLLMWGTALLLGVMLGYFRWQLLLLIPMWMALFSTRIIWLRLKDTRRASPDA